MCASQKLLKKTPHGTLTFCNQSKLFQFVFNNLCFELYEWELENFITFLNRLDVNYWEEELKCSLHQRKIPVSVGCSHFMILLNKQELNELRQLLSNDFTIDLLSSKEINYALTYN
ncbi:MAG: DUF6686 family protein [Bacteroidota bacterium]